MRHRNFIFSLFILIFAGCKTDHSSAENRSGIYQVELTCGEKSDAPSAGVFAIVNANKTKIANVNACDSIGVDAFSGLGIPADALNAVGGWWAGSGDYFYARKGGENEILFYHGVTDEMSEETQPKFQVIAAFRDGSFHFQH